MSEDRSAAEWAARVLLGVAGVAFGLYVTSVGWAVMVAGENRYLDEPLLSGTAGWLLVLAGLALAGGSGVWAFLPKPQDRPAGH